MTLDILIYLVPLVGAAAVVLTGLLAMRMINAHSPAQVSDRPAAARKPAAAAHIQR
jgi:hypothetical protein